MALVTGPHRVLFSMLSKILNEKYGGGQHSEEKRLKPKSASLVDFGARIKIIVSEVQGKSQIELKVTFQGDYEIHHNETIDCLRALYGMSVGLTRFDDQRKVTISVKVDDAIAHFDSPQSCARSLSQIRVQAAGSPILKALSRMDDQQRGNTSANEDNIYKLGTHGKCGTFHCISTNEK